MTATHDDRLLGLLPLVYSQRDADAGWALRDLLRLISEQVALVEGDIEQLYDNWFIETCEDWVVPYLGDLLGYRPAAPTSEPGSGGARAWSLRQRAISPRRDVANTIRHRRRKGTLALLEQLAADVTGWPARAVEFYRLLAVSQHLDHLRLDRGRTVDLRAGDALDRLDGPFDELAHAIAIGRVTSHRTRATANIPEVGLFVWRLIPQSRTQTPARAIERTRNRFTFDVLGVDSPLMTAPLPEPGPSHIAGELNVPGWISRRGLDERRADVYGAGRSFQVFVAPPSGRGRARAPVPVEESAIVAADLSGWTYHPRPGEVAVDPVLGRIAFSPRDRVDRGVWVTYRRGFSRDIAGGEYLRSLTPVAGRSVYHVGHDVDARPRLHATIGEAVVAWERDRAAFPDGLDALIEIQDGEEYVESPLISLRPGDHLEIRAAQGRVPLVRLLDLHANRPDSWQIEALDGPGEHDPADGADPTAATGTMDGTTGDATEDGAPRGDASAPATDVPKPDGQDCGEPEVPVPCDDAGHRAARPRLLIDGLVIAGRSLQLRGDLGRVVIRHATLVPGWSLDSHCRPEYGDEPSLELEDVCGTVSIEQAIVGSILVRADRVESDPLPIAIADSIVDATDRELDAVSGPDGSHAHVLASIARTTIIGATRIHALALGDDAIFDGPLRVGRRRIGCVRFSYVAPGSRTPRRFACQPDMAVEALATDPGWNDATPEERTGATGFEEQRVRPRYTAIHYGQPAYLQLAESCPVEIATGADDSSEMGAFHDLFQPQRIANLRARLADSTPAATDAGLIFAT